MHDTYSVLKDKVNQIGWYSVATYFYYLTELIGHVTVSHKNKEDKCNELEVFKWNQLFHETIFVWNYANIVGDQTTY